MELKVYNWEFFERNKTRYLVFGLVILLVILLCVFSSNIVWWVFILMVAGWYFYYLTKVNDTISMVIWKKALQIWKGATPWSSLSGFVLEYHIEKERIHNIVIIDNKKTPSIFTINDSEANLKKFVEQLADYIPMLDKYNQSTLDKVIRKLKL